ncbi:unnamed protein product [Chrysodeixis includens]|uniref:Uncharacterized protein n=1 Tax=Chrysodeixis includens TaxID=689277 RepID=A0A9N8L047_CHRIL|nr:unnamed protein product [Chrysodeixis includens]
MAPTMVTPAHERYSRETELRPQHSRDGSRDSGIFHTTKGLWNAPGQNNCFLNSAVQKRILTSTVNTLSHYQFFFFFFVVPSLLRIATTYNIPPSSAVFRGVNRSVHAASNSPPLPIG